MRVRKTSADGLREQSLNISNSVADFLPECWKRGFEQSAVMTFAYTYLTTRGQSGQGNAVLLAGMAEACEFFAATGASMRRETIVEMAFDLWAARNGDTNTFTHCPPRIRKACLAYASRTKHTKG